ncbi:DUF4123 domain-containing protein [uncultured Shewanella sp.]|uniref:DUF4123 domain-containing protein n=1 Tax=uncultured Shewanella sp. TaxID=173975 RepID=UPI0026295D6C|nr:DUF4123 domain-containing protein [uncultured Shewanella sp.]
MDTIDNPLLLTASHSHEYWLESVKQGGCFILAEAVLNEWIPSIADALVNNGSEKCRLYWGEAGRIHGSISPYLLPVSLNNWQQIEEEVCYQEGWGIAIKLDKQQDALTSAQQFNALLNHLRQWTVVDTHDGQQVLRLSDWQVLSTLLQSSDEKALSAFFGQIDSVMYMGPEHAQQEVDSKGKSVPWQSLQAFNKQPVEDETQWPRTLSQPQQVALAQMMKKEQYQAYQGHLHQYHSETKEWHDKQMLSFIEQQLNIATQHDFNNPQDKVRFLSLSVVFGQDFVEQPWAKSVLKQDKQRGAVSKMDKLHEAAMAQIS